MTPDQVKLNHILTTKFNPYLEITIFEYLEYILQILLEYHICTILVMDQLNLNGNNISDNVVRIFYHTYKFFTNIKQDENLQIGYKASEIESRYFGKYMLYIDDLG